MVLISIIHLQKIKKFSKFGGRGSIFKLAMPLWSSNLKQAWWAYFLSHTFKILKKCVFIKDKEMILVPLFDISNHIFLNQEKSISFCHFRPASVQNSLFCTKAGLIQQTEIGLFQIMHFWQEFRKNGSNSISSSL